jgi:effector-binding domain-containing protein
VCGAGVDVQLDQDAAGSLRITIRLTMRVNTPAGTGLSPRGRPHTGLTVTGPAGGIFADEIFTDDRGRATIFLPCAGEVRAMGRTAPLTVPAAELAIIEHRGPHDDVDRSYGALATYVARHALAVDGPIREFYVTARHETADESRWRTEIGWPIFTV